MIKLKSIKIERGEGPYELCGVLHNVKSFREADRIMFQQAESAPKNGGYDKCDYTVEWADGSTYQGRYDMKHPDSRGFVFFSDCFWDGVTFYAGYNIPSHFTLKKYTAFVKNDTEFSLSLLNEFELLAEDTSYKGRLMRDYDEKRRWRDELSRGDF